ncbi:MAG: DUF58 domain-containing protein [Pirellulales bacterium]|nr:DUF58 domain-containing protein [Pirellulales bacterium]
MSHAEITKDSGKRLITVWFRRWHCWFRVLATYDCFPEFSAKVRRLVYNPLGVLLVAALVALACGLLLHPRVLALCGGLLAIIGTGICWPWLTLRGVRGSVAFDRDRAAEGDTVAATVTVSNHLPWPAWGLSLRGGYGDAAAPDRNRAIAARLTTVGARQRSVHRWQFTPRRRGEYPLCVPLLVTGFPFGVWESKRGVSVEQRLVVWPRTFPVGPVPVSDGDEMVEGNVARNKVGSAGDVLGVRPYRRGDSPRRIHWPQSARHDRLIVCELQTTALPVIQIVLDADPLVHSGRGPNGSREWAIRIAASFAKGWLEAGAQVGIVYGGVAISPASGAAQMRRILDALARLPDECPMPLVDLLASPPCRISGWGVQVVITTDRRTQIRRRDTDGRQRWVVLCATGFVDAFEDDARPASTRPTGQCWLLIEAPSRVPHLLRYGWSEARHGS